MEKLKGQVFGSETFNNRCCNRSRGLGGLLGHPEWVWLVIDRTSVYLCLAAALYRLEWSGRPHEEEGLLWDWHGVFGCATGRRAGQGKNKNMQSLLWDCEESALLKVMFKERRCSSERQRTGSLEKVRGLRFIPNAAGASEWLWATPSWLADEWLWGDASSGGRTCTAELSPGYSAWNGVEGSQFSDSK